MEINELQIGDTLVSASSYYGDEITSIERETKTQWILHNGTRVYKKDLHSVGGYRIYKIVSEEELTQIKNGIIMSKIRWKLRHYDWEHFSEDKVKQVWNIINNKN